MSYKNLLLKLKEKVDQKARFRMEVVQDSLILSCCIYTSPRGVIPLTVQHYLEQKKTFNISCEPSLKVDQNKIYIVQKIPLKRVLSFRIEHDKFLKRAQNYKNVLQEVCQETNVNVHGVLN